MSATHLGLRHGESWSEAHHRLALFVVRRKRDGKFRDFNDLTGGWWFRSTDIGTADGCCLPCKRWAMRHFKMSTDEFEIVERRWDGERWIEVRVVDQT